MRTLKGKLVMPEKDLRTIEFGIYSGIEYVSITDILNDTYFNQDNQYIELQIITKDNTYSLSGELCKKKNEFGVIDWFVAVDEELENGNDLGGLLFDLVGENIELVFRNIDIN